ncbi:MAG: AtpZ/AtpI family protein [Armatimonadetes bacterium]|nr:AtpZ/AtpI family protein [Armatimonadota bacterium]MDW8122964.1 AtpZ/AtpI family protein [Armatimonadota bacterium]
MGQKSDHRRVWGVAAAMGSLIAGSVIAGLLIGAWVDNRWGIDPIGKALGVFIGGIGGLIEAGRTVVKAMKRRKTD